MTTPGSSLLVPDFSKYAMEKQAVAPLLGGAAYAFGAGLSALSGLSAIDAARKGNWGDAALYGVGVIPGIGWAGKALTRGGRALKFATGIGKNSPARGLLSHGFRNSRAAHSLGQGMQSAGLGIQKMMRPMHRWASKPGFFRGLTRGITQVGSGAKIPWLSRGGVGGVLGAAALIGGTMLMGDGGGSGQPYAPNQRNMLAGPGGGQGGPLIWEGGLKSVQPLSNPYFHGMRS